MPANTILDTTIPSTIGSSSDVKHKAKHWLNVPLGIALAGIAMDALDKDGNRVAKGDLRAVYDFLIDAWKDLPCNVMNDVIVNGIAMKYYHIDDSQPKTPKDLGIVLG